MCGRTAQSRQGVEKGSDMLSGAERDTGRGSRIFLNKPGESSGSLNNNNLSPGMNAVVFVKGSPIIPAASAPGLDNAQVSQNRQQRGCLHDPVPSIECAEKFWGLVTRGGTVQSPLPPGATKHFSGLMFNARSDTLYDKRSFRELALRGNTCVMAVDGFYEWKAPDKDTLGGSSGKQPYYVCRSDGLPLLIAGLWTSVPTGQKFGYDGKPEMLHTFTLLTTDVCPKLGWLHNRMPVTIWDTKLAVDWLLEPTQALEKRMAHVSSNTNANELSWHPVTKRMSSGQYRGDDCTNAIKIEKVPSVKSFFGHQFAVKKSVDGDTKLPGDSFGVVKSETSRKRPVPFAPASYPKKPAKATHTGTLEKKSPVKKKKPQSPQKGSITSFFAPKK